MIIIRECLDGQSRIDFLKNLAMLLSVVNVDTRVITRLIVFDIKGIFSVSTYTTVRRILHV